MNTDNYDYIKNLKMNNVNEFCKKLELTIKFNTVKYKIQNDQILIDLDTQIDKICDDCKRIVNIRKCLNENIDNINKIKDILHGKLLIVKTKYKNILLHYVCTNGRFKEYLQKNPTPEFRSKNIQSYILKYYLW